MSVTFRLMASCLWCDKEIPLKANCNGKLLCSLKCLDAINKKIGDKNFFYSKDEVYIKKGRK